jgi:hypothetical protein
MVELAVVEQTQFCTGTRARTGELCRCLWTDTRETDGSQPLPFLTDVLQRFVRWFPPTVERRKVHVPDGLLALASDRAVVIVNTTDKRISASVDGRQMEWSAYQTRWVTANLGVDGLSLLRSGLAITIIRSKHHWCCLIGRFLSFRTIPHLANLANLAGGQLQSRYEHRLRQPRPVLRSGQVL